MHRRDCIKIGAAGIVGLVSLAGCMGPGGGEDDEEDGGGGGDDGDGDGDGEGDDDIESNAQDGRRDTFVSPE